MSSPERHPRQRMVESAAVLMRELGTDGTSFSEVLRHSAAPRGSIYHHFPGGKAQLLEEATRWAGDVVVRHMERALERDDPVAFLDAWGVFWLGVLEQTDFAAGCPIVAGSLEGGRLPNVRDAAADVFGEWERILAEGLEAHGVEPARARTLAVTVFSAMEGAVVLARAQRSAEPVEATLAELRTLVGGALAARASET